MEQFFLQHIFYSSIIPVQFFQLGLYAVKNKETKPSQILSNDMSIKNHIYYYCIILYYLLQRLDLHVTKFLNIHACINSFSWLFFLFFGLLAGREVVP